MKDFFANEAALRFVNLAYNIISLFRQVSSEKPKQHRLQTLRLNCYAVGAWMTKKGNSKILKLTVPIKKRKWMDGKANNISPEKWLEDVLNRINGIKKSELVHLLPNKWKKSTL
jgi:hypothetical protein